MTSAPAGTEVGGAPFGPCDTVGASRGDGAARQRAERHWRRPALGTVVIFVVTSVLLVQFVPRVISVQWNGREKTMESKLQLAQRAADAYALEHDGYYPSAWSGFASRLPEDWWESPFGGAIDTATVAAPSPPADALHLGLAVYEPADLDPVRCRPRAGRFYSVSYRGKLLHSSAGSNQPGDL